MTYFPSSKTQLWNNAKSLVHTLRPSALDKESKESTLSHQGEAAKMIIRLDFRERIHRHANWADF